MLPAVFSVNLKPNQIKPTQMATAKKFDAELRNRFPRIGTTVQQNINGPVVSFTVARTTPLNDVTSEQVLTSLIPFRVGEAI